MRGDGMAQEADASALAVVRHFWQLMSSNDFTAVGSVLADDFMVEWPQSGERIRGRDNFARMNAEYPAHGPWQFEIVRLFGEGPQIVSEVRITDGVQRVVAISFFTVQQGKVVYLREYWPEPFAAPDNRKHLLEPML